MRILASAVSFLVGIVVGAVGLGGYWYMQHSATEVWVATDTLVSDEGIVIPAGTELILDTWMPEGFAALELGINVEGGTFDHFQHRTENKSFLRIPYFIHRERN